MWNKKNRNMALAALAAVTLLWGCSVPEEGAQVDVKPNQELASAKTPEETEAEALIRKSEELSLKGAVEVLDGEETKENESVETAEEGENAVLVGENGILNALRLNIHTTGNKAGGLMTVMGGNINSTEAKISTEGFGSAGIALYSADSMITVTGGKVDTTGTESPCLYAEGNIYVNQVTGTAEQAEMAVMKNGGSLYMSHSSLSGNGISVSGRKAGEGVNTLSFSNSVLTSGSNPALFTVENAKTEIAFKNTELQSPPEIFLSVLGGREKSGSYVVLAADQQRIAGDILCDETSAAAVSLKNGSAFEGSIDPGNTGNVSISLEGDSSWILTGDSYLTSITDEAELSNINSNGYTIYYDASQQANGWLQGLEIKLMDGGKLIPLNAVDE